MATVRNIWKIFIFLILCNSLVVIQGALEVNVLEKLPIISLTTEFICTYRLKLIYVYFENQTSLTHPGTILKEFNDCGISIISLRNLFETSPLEDIKDDGILMYLVLILPDASQPLELTMLNKKSSAKHLSHVFVLIQNSNEVTANWLQSTFKEFWMIWLLNVVIIYWRDEQLHIYRYNPFHNDYLIPVHHRDRLPQLDELFPKKLPNMHRRKLNMCMYSDEIRAKFLENEEVIGIDGLMSDFIVKSLNATRVIRKKSRISNNSSEICLTEIESELDDIAMNTRFLAITSFRNRVESTIAHNRDDLCIMVPKAKLASIFWNIFHAFTQSVWRMILLTLLLTYVFYKVVWRQEWRNRNIFLQLLCAALSMPLTHIPHPFPQRLFLFLWILYAMVISNSYKGNLMSNLMFVTYLPDLNTLQDFALSPYKLQMFQRHTKHMRRYLNLSSPNENIIFDKLIGVKDEELWDNIKYNNVSTAYLIKDHIALHHVYARNHFHNGRQLFHKMDTCLVPFHAVYIVPYGSPLLGYVNQLVRSSHEFGFYAHWERRMNFMFMKSGKRIMLNNRIGDDTDGLIVLTLKHVQAAFCILGLGLGLAGLVFIFERVY